MSSPRDRIALRPELARSSWLETMTGKSLRKIGRDKQGKQRKKSAYMGRRRFKRGLFSLEAGLKANRTCTGEQEVQREGLVQR
jgi:hypothetical protein